MISIVELFGAAGLSPCGPVGWGEPVKEFGPGVYVVVEGDDRILYIGRASRSVSRRIGQFYRHKDGAKSPHKGGEKILSLKQPKFVFWAPTQDFCTAESRMINVFKACEGELPYGNKIGGMRVRNNQA